MIRRVIDSSIKFRKIVVAVALGIVIFGVMQSDQIKTDVLPEFGPVTVEVQTEALGLSAGEVERLITIPLEQDLLSGVAFLEDIESASLPGLSSVVMTFEPGTDLLDARQVVGERLVQAAALPQVAGHPQMLQPLSSTGRVALVSLSSDELTPIETSVLARWVVAPRLLGVEGVANVSIWGFRDRQLQVLVDPEELDARGVTLSQVISTTGNALEVSPLTFLEASSPGTGGFIDTVNQRLHVFHEQAISTPEELSQVAIEGPDGGAVYVDDLPLTLGDVAEIVADHQPLIGDAFCSDGPCVLLVIEKFPETNTLEVTANVEEALDLLAPGLTGLEMDSSIYRPASFITTSFSNLGNSLAIGGVLLLIVLMAFLYRWRTVLVSLASISVSLAGAALVLYFFGVTANAMTMAGLVLGLIVVVDNAILGSWDLGRMDLVATRSSSTTIMPTRSSAFYAAVIAAAIVLTFYPLTGEAGAFLPRVASAYLIAMAVALIVGITVTPALSASLLGNGQDGQVPAERSLRAGFTRMRRSWVANPIVSLVVFAVVVGVALAVLPGLDRTFRPDLQQRDVLVQLNAPAGTSLNAMDELAADVVASVRGIAGIENVGAHVGRAITSDQVTNVNTGEVWVKISGDAPYDATLEAIDAEVGASTDVPFRVLTYSEQRVSEILGRSSDELVVRIYGDDPGTLAEVGDDLYTAMVDIPGLRDLRVDRPIEEMTIEVEVDLIRAQEFGLKPGDVRRHATTILSGIVVGNLFEDQKVFDVVVWGDPALRQSVDDVRNMKVPAPSGDLVTLADVADVRVVPNVAVIKHQAVSPYLDIRAEVGDRNLAGLATDVAGAIEDVTFPLEYHAELLGGYTAQRDARTSLLTVVAAALIGIFILLQSAFGSWRLASLVFASLAMPLGGAVLAVVFSGDAVRLGTVAGLVGVFALGARMAVMLVQSYQARERDGMDFGPELVEQTSVSLLLPMVVTLVALMGVFLPLAVAGPRAGLEIVTPLAVAVVGGLVALIPYSLIVLPSFYERWGFVEVPDMVGEDLGDLLDLSGIRGVSS